MTAQFTPAIFTLVVLFLTIPPVAGEELPIDTGTLAHIDVELGPDSLRDCVRPIIMGDTEGRPKLTLVTPYSLLARNWEAGVVVLDGQRNGYFGIEFGC